MNHNTNSNISNNGDDNKVLAVGNPKAVQANGPVAAYARSLAQTEAYII